MKVASRFIQWPSLFCLVLVACGKVAPSPFVRDPGATVGLPPAPDSNATPNPQDRVDPTQPTPLPSSQYCSPSQDHYEESISLERGQVEGSNDYAWGRGGGCLLRPLDEVWSTLFNHDLVKWGGVSEIEVSSLAPVARSRYHYEVKYIVHDFITVSWTMEWFHTVTESDADRPKTVVINFQRVRGTRYVPYWEGSIVLTKLTPEVTGFAMSNQIRANRTGPDEAAGGILDMVRALRTGHGQFPLLF